MKNLKPNTNWITDLYQLVVSRHHHNAVKTNIFANRYRNWQTGSMAQIVLVWEIQSTKFNHENFND